MACHLRNHGSQVLSLLLGEAPLACGPFFNLVVCFLSHVLFKEKLECLRVAIEVPVPVLAL
eukprot:9089558-Prorocentrum_lima.AAC.1